MNTSIRTLARTSLVHVRTGNLKIANTGRFVSVNAQFTSSCRKVAPGGSVVWAKVRFENCLPNLFSMFVSVVAHSLLKDIQKASEMINTA